MLTDVIHVNCFIKERKRRMTNYSSLMAKLSNTSGDAPGINFSTIVNNKTNTTVVIRPSPVPSAVTFTLGVIGNVIAIFFLLKASKSHRWNAFYRLVAALAVTDLFGILSTSPVAFAVYDNDVQWVGGEPLCNYHAFMLTFAGLSTVMFVGAMAWDRCLAVSCPIMYSQMNKNLIVNVVVGTIWILSSFISCFPLMGFSKNVRQFPGTWCFFNFFGDTTEDIAFAMMYSIIGLGIILMTAILNSIVIVGLMRGKGSRARRTSVSSKSARARSDVYITVFLVAILVTFAICWAPFLIRIIINTTRAFKVNSRADLATLRLATLNQILDPWVYILLRREVLYKVAAYIRKKRQSSFLVRFASFTSSFKSHASDDNDNENDKMNMNGQIPSTSIKLKELNNVEDQRVNEQSENLLQVDISHCKDEPSLPPETNANEITVTDAPLSEDDDKCIE